MHQTIEESVRLMKERFAPAGREVAAWPEPPGATPAELNEIEARLGARLPPVFRAAVSRYDFRNAVAGNVSMCRANSFVEWLAQPNCEPLPDGHMAWWRGAKRPAHLALIAQSDAHLLLLDLSTDAIKAIWIDDLTHQPRV